MRYYDRRDPTFMEMVGAVFLVTMLVLLVVDGIVRHMEAKEMRPNGGTAVEALNERQTSDLFFSHNPPSLSTTEENHGN